MRGGLDRTFDLRLRHGMQALEMHLLFAALETTGIGWRLEEGSFCSSLGRIVRMTRW